MRRFQLGAFMALTAAVFVAASSGVAPAAVSPSATGSQALASRLAERDRVRWRGRCAGHRQRPAGSTGTATNVMLVLDLSGSTGVPPSKLADLKARRHGHAGRARRRRRGDRQIDRRQPRGHRRLPGLHGHGPGRARILLQRRSSAAINGLPASPTARARTTSASTLADSSLAAGGAGFAKSHRADHRRPGERRGARRTRTPPRRPPRRTASASSRSASARTSSTANLQSWASQSSYYQSGTPGPIDKTKLITDLGAAVAVPTTFTVTETLGRELLRRRAELDRRARSRPAPGSLQWTGTLAGNRERHARLPRDAQRQRRVRAHERDRRARCRSPSAAARPRVTPPAAISIDVLPCGGTPIATTTCTGRRVQRQRHRRAACSTRSTRARRRPGRRSR